MLFRTVYGPELEAIYRFVLEATIAEQTVSREALHLAFVPRQASGDLGSAQNVDDALLFLSSARLISDAPRFAATSLDRCVPFRLRCLRSLRRIERHEVSPKHPADPLFLLLLDELFIKPDCLFLPNMHVRANQIGQVKEVGGLSREKTQAWQRVMSFLGLGRRVAGGFQCVFGPDLLLEIARAWSPKQGTLQAFLEEHLTLLLPYARKEDGDVALALQAPLDHLVRLGALQLTQLQDSPSRPYFGERRLRSIRIIDGPCHGD